MYTLNKVQQQQQRQPKRLETAIKGSVLEA